MGRGSIAPSSKVLRFNCWINGFFDDDGKRELFNGAWVSLGRSRKDRDAVMEAVRGHGFDIKMLVRQNCMEIKKVVQ
jgi:hypothetical protein